MPWALSEVQTLNTERISDLDWTTLTAGRAAAFLRQDLHPAPEEAEVVGQLGGRRDRGGGRAGEEQEGRPRQEAERRHPGVPDVDVESQPGGEQDHQQRSGGGREQDSGRDSRFD